VSCQRTASGAADAAVAPATPKSAARCDLQQVRTNNRIDADRGDRQYNEADNHAAARDRDRDQPAARRALSDAVPGALRSPHARTWAAEQPRTLLVGHRAASMQPHSMLSPPPCTRV